MDGLNSPSVRENANISSNCWRRKSMWRVRAAVCTSVMQSTVSFVKESDSTICLTLARAKHPMAQKGAFHSSLFH